VEVSLENDHRLGLQQDVPKKVSPTRQDKLFPSDVTRIEEVRQENDRLAYAGRGQEDPAREERKGAPTAGTARYTCGRSLRGDAQCTNIWGATGTVIHACCFGIRLRHVGATPWPRDEHTMFRLERIAQAGYQVRVQWE